MVTELKWHGDRVMRDIGGIMRKRLARAAISWTRFAARNLGAKQNRKPYRNPSAPGGYPAEATSQLKKQISAAGWEMAPRPELKAIVGTNLRHGRWLQTGTSRMRPRPWMSITNMLMAAKIKAILGRPIR